MQCGSTGLGKMSLKMKLVDESKMNKLPPTKPPEGSLVMYCKTYDPVIWNVWIGIGPEDIGSMLKMVFRRGTWAFAFKSLIRLGFSKLRVGRRNKKDTAVKSERVKISA